MSRKTSAVAGGDTGSTDQYNNLRDEAEASSRLLPRQQSSPDLTLYVSEGIIYIGGSKIEFAGGNSPSFTAPVSNPRIDVLSINSSGTLVRTAGAEAGSPTAPAVPTGNVPICQVYNRVGQTSVKEISDGSNGYIYKDTRPFIVLETFIDSSSGSSDAGKGVKTNSDGLVDNTFLKPDNITLIGRTAGEAISGATTPVPVFVGHGESDVLQSASGSGTYFDLYSGTGVKMAMKFTAGASGGIDTLKVKLKKTNTPTGTATFKLYSDSGGNPSANLYTFGTYNVASLTGSFADVSIQNVSAKYNLVNGTTYWIYIDVTGISGASFDVQYGTSGSATIKYWNGSSWGNVSTSAVQYFALSSTLENGKFYVSDADNTARDEFDGFVNANHNAGDTNVKVNVRGKQGGFTGLTIGSKYYVSNTLGTLSTSAGATSLEVGKAISATEILK